MERWHIQFYRTDGSFDCYHTICDTPYAEHVLQYYVDDGCRPIGAFRGPWWLAHGERCQPMPERNELALSTTASLAPN
jgi:hypothetical protein